MRVNLILEWVSQSSHQGERESRSQGEGLQVTKSYSDRRTREMRLAREIVETVSYTDKRLLESRVQANLHARFGCDVQSRMFNKIDWKVRSLLGDALFSAPT